MARNTNKGTKVTPKASEATEATEVEQVEVEQVEVEAFTLAVPVGAVEQVEAVTAAMAATAAIEVEAESVPAVPTEADVAEANKAVARAAFRDAVDATADDATYTVPAAHVVAVSLAFGRFTVAARNVLASEVAAEVAGEVMASSDPASGMARMFASTAVTRVIAESKGTGTVKVPKVAAPRDLVGDAVAALASVDLLAALARGNVLAGLTVEQVTEASEVAAMVAAGWPVPAGFAPRWPGKARGTKVATASTGERIDVMGGIRDAANASDAGTVLTVSALAKSIGCGTGSVDDVWLRTNVKPETMPTVTATRGDNGHGREVRVFIVA